MAYIQGFVAAAPSEGEGEDRYRAFSEKASGLFKEFGALRQVEAWADDVADGKVTDFRKAVQARDGESVVFSWLEYPDRATYDAANEKLMNDPRMAEMGEMPFDGQRMIFGGFEPFVDVGEGRGGYVDGFVLPVPHARRQAYHDLAAASAAQFRKYGATRIVEAWGDDVPDGKVTDFKKSVQAVDGEGVVFSFIEWPSKQVRDEAWPKIMQDPEMQPPAEMPFDGQRMFWGGFRPILDA